MPISSFLWNMTLLLNKSPSPFILIQFIHLPIQLTRYSSIHKNVLLIKRHHSGIFRATSFGGVDTGSDLPGRFIMALSPFSSHLSLFHLHRSPLATFHLVTVLSSGSCRLLLPGCLVISKRGRLSTLLPLCSCGFAFCCFFRHRPFSPSTPPKFTLLHLHPSQIHPCSPFTPLELTCIPSFTAPEFIIFHRSPHPSSPFSTFHTSQISPWFTFHPSPIHPFSVATPPGGPFKGANRAL